MTDENGNKLYIKSDNIYISLANESFPRKIAKFINDNTVEMFRNYSKHLHRKSNSFGFNLKVLNSNLFENIILKTDKQEKFHIKVKDILEKGNIQYYKQQGFEKQIFYSIENL